jgi:hypothetical protein
MFSWLLARPAIVIDLVFGGVLLAFGLYFWISHNEMNRLLKDLSDRTTQLQQSEAAVKSLSDRLVLLQRLNDDFNKSIVTIQRNQRDATVALQKFDLPKQAVQQPKQTEDFINNRNAQILQHLNNLSHNLGELAK